jgi:hypothetical protein
MTSRNSWNKPDEPWAERLARLERHHNSNASDDLGYRVTFRLLNAEVIQDTLTVLSMNQPKPLKLGCMVSLVGKICSPYLMDKFALSQCVKLRGYRRFPITTIFPVLGMSRCVRLAMPSRLPLLMLLRIASAPIYLTIEEDSRHVVLCPIRTKSFFEYAAGFVVLLLLSAVVALTGKNLGFSFV